MQDSVQDLLVLLDLSDLSDLPKQNQRTQNPPKVKYKAANKAAKGKAANKAAKAEEISLG